MFEAVEHPDSLLVSASKSGNLDAVKYLVEQRGADVSAQNNYAFCMAARFGHLEMLKYLVEKGVDVTSQNDYAICTASRSGHLDVVKYLVENGAGLAVSYAMCLACDNGYTQVVKYLLKNGADAKAQNNYPICRASQYGHLELVKCLLKNGAVASGRDNYSIRMASQNGHLEIVKCLVDYGADESLISEWDKKYIGFRKRRIELCLRRFQLKCRLHLMRNAKFIMKQAERSYDELFGSQN